MHSSRHNILTDNKGVLKPKYYNIKCFFHCSSEHKVYHTKPASAAQVSDKIHTLYKTKHKRNNNNNNNLHQATFSAGDQNLSLHDTEIQKMKILLFVLYC
jgi:hypothetical protein